MNLIVFRVMFIHQPPSGGCVLKPLVFATPKPTRDQPPSGGCVLKLCKEIQ